MVAGIGLEMARTAHRSGGGLNSLNFGPKFRLGIFVGNPDEGGLLVGLPVGCGGVDGQAVGLAVGVCLGALCAARSVVAGRVGRMQL